MRIVIVEDEEKTRNGLANLIKKLAPHYSVIGTAENGIEGLKLVENTMPDVIISDIIMPEMDGIEMIRNIRDKNYACEIIILSGYAEFGYAKDAINFKVFDYLLKPVTKKILKEMLIKVEDYIIDKEFALKSSITLASTYEKMMCLETYGNSKYTSRFIAESRLLNEKFVSTLIAFTSMDIVNDELILSLHRTIRSCGFDISNQHYSISPTNKPNTALLMFFSVNIQDFSMFLRRFVDIWCMQQDNRSKPLIVFDNNIKIEHLPRVIRDLTEKSKWGIVFSEQNCLSVEQIKKFQISRFVYPDNLETKLFNHLKVRDFFSAQSDLNVIFTSFSNKIYHYNAIYKALHRIVSGITCMIETIAEENINFDKDYLIQMVDNYSHMYKIRDALSRIINNLECQYNNTSSNNFLVKRLLFRVEKNYMKPITLGEISEEFKISPKYLGMLFKQETGMDFSTYLRQYRIQKAITIMKTERKQSRIIDIAKCVGIPDEKYFSKVFKEVTGVTPGKYAKNIE